MRAQEFLTEARELSRRGFLKGLAGAAAQAAIPGGVANLTKAGSTVTPAAVASRLPALFSTAMAYGLEQGWLGHVYPGNVDPEDYEADPELTKPQGRQGEMPWGEHYELKKTPSGQEYLVTTAPYGDTAVFTYVKDGEVRNIEVAWDSEGHGYGEVLSSQDEEDMNAMYDFIDAHGEDPKSEGAMIDAIIKGTVDASGVDQDEKQSVNTAPADLARLAGVAKKGIDALTPQQTNKPAQPTDQATPGVALPAPGSLDVLEPELNKQKVSMPQQKK